MAGLYYPPPAANAHVNAMGGGELEQGGCLNMKGSPTIGTGGVWFTGIRERSMGLRASMPRAALAHVGLTKALGDCLAWAGGIGLAAVVRWDLSAARLGTELPRVLALAAVAAVVQIAAGMAIGLYRNHWRFGSFEEVAIVVGTVGITLCCMLGASWAISREVPPALLSLGAASAAASGMLGIRYLWRVAEQHRLRPIAAAHRVLIFGAGEGAEQLLQSLLRNPDAKCVPVALLDDDPRKANLRVKGIRVVGDRYQIASAAHRFGADLLVLAVPSADATLVRSITDLARDAGIGVRVLPSTSELINGTVSASDIRTPTIADLLGRRPVQIDLSSAASYLRNRRVLVTGAGGSIGSELCRQIAKFAPDALIMVDRDESALHAVQLSLDGRGMLDSPDLVLLDIRDRDSVRHLMVERRPEVVFHAAALKHLTLLEAHPGEAIKSNVWGTRNLLEAAMATGVGRFVNISTDKAANPTSSLGLSKRIAERLTAHAAWTASRGIYLSVRFGNVLGSRGSVIPAFQAQIRRGGPLCVTDPGVKRYFMTIEEAVQLVIQAGAIGSAGSVIVLDMGEPVRIVDVAKRMIAESGRDIEVVYPGLRPGEKLHEELFGDGERPEPAAHPMLAKVYVPELDPESVASLPTRGEQATIRAELERVCFLSPTPAELFDLTIRRERGGHRNLGRGLAGPHQEPTDLAEGKARAWREPG